MIRVTTPDGTAHLLHPDAMASICEAGPSSQWHGIRAYVHLFNGKVLEVRETLREIEVQTAAAGRDAWLPIRTAPRDGRSVLVRFGEDGVSQAKYIPGLPHPWLFIDTNDGISWMLNHAVDGPGGPSHWRALPE